MNLERMVVGVLKDGRRELGCGSGAWCVVRGRMEMRGGRRLLIEGRVGWLRDARRMAGAGGEL